MARGQSQDFDVDMTSECEAWDDTTGMCKCAVPVSVVFTRMHKPSIKNRLTVFFFR